MVMTLYDTFGKRWRVPGSLLMGGARASNAAAGMLASAISVEFVLTRPGPAALAYPIAIGGYTVLLTFASTFEEDLARVHHRGAGRAVPDPLHNLPFVPVVHEQIPRPQDLLSQGGMG